MLRRLRQQPFLREVRQYGGAVVLVALYVATVGTLKLFSNDSDWSFCNFGPDGGWAACDQPYHLEQINYFIAHPGNWLRYPDPWQTATFPGFHLFVAFIARLLGIATLGPDTWLRLIPFFLGLLVLGVLWRVFWGLSLNGRLASILCLPILWSNYFYLPSLFFVTENAAYLGYAILLFTYLEFPRRSVVMGCVGLATVYARQIFLPVIFTPVSLISLPQWRNDGGATARRIAFAIAPGLALFALYYFAWGGPVPREELQEHSAHALLEPGPPLQGIALLGLLAVPYAALCLPALRTLGRKVITLTVVTSTIFAAALWALLPTTRDLDLGRAGSVIWMLGRIAPLDSMHAPLVLPCLVLGCAAIGAMIALAREHHYCPVELVMFALYIGGLSLQRLSYQRYSEVITLILLSATAARWGPSSRIGLALFLAAFITKLAITLSMPQGG